MSEGLRKFHSKSRNSCRQCKKRRVKCDLQAPICSHCRRRKEHCDFLGIHATFIETEVITTSHTIPTQLPNTSQTSEAGLRVDMLMSHYLHETAITLPISANIAPFWQYTLPCLAQRYKFIWHSLLSISALHLGHKHTINEPDYLALGRSHYLKATNAFRASTRDLSEENSTAVFGFSVLVGMFHFKVSLQTERISAKNTLEALEPLLALRSGLKLVCDGLGGLLQSDEQQKTLVRAAAGFETQDNDMIRQLNDFERDISLIDCETKCYQHSIQALRLLRESYEKFGTTPKSWYPLAWWPYNLSQEYIESLSSGDSIAFSIFKSWCRFVRNAPSKWFWDGWADRVLAIIEIS